MAAFTDLTEHTGTLVALLSALAGVCALLIGVIYKVMMRIALTLKEDILDMIAKLDDRVGDVWEEIGKIRDRQERLREELPEKYLRLEGPGYRVLIDGIHEIKEHFNAFTKDCRNGKCGAQKIGGNGNNLS